MNLAHPSAANGGSKALVEEVLLPERCSGCGMCVGLCPYIKNLREKTVVIHPCGLTSGNCYRVCPQTPTDYLDLDQKVFGQARQDNVFGVYRSIHYARATDPKFQKRGQYGGTVSALTAFALEAGTIDGAVMTSGRPEEFTRGMVVHNREEVLANAGSKYSAAPSLQAFHQAARTHQKLGVVGRGCQVTAMRKLQSVDEPPGLPPSVSLNGDKAALVIGLFCFWSLDPKFHDLVLEKAAGRTPERVDIPKTGMVLYAGGEAIPVSMEEIRPLIKPVCLTCPDPTSELADLSVGSTEHLDEYNTLIVRSARGEELVKKAAAAGVIELKEYPAGRLPLLRGAVSNKKERVEVAKREPAQRRA